MTLHLSVDPAAEDDIMEAFRWYEARSAGLGDRFLDSLDNAFQQVIENPLAFPSVIEGVRRTLTRTFPYLVFYSLDATAVHILAVIHAAQDPVYLAERLKV